MDKMHGFFSLFRHSAIPRCAAVILAALVALTWNSLAFCGEIHDAAKQGDLGKVKALVNGNPELVFSKDRLGATPLDWAAKKGHKDVAELLLANGADINAGTKDGWTPLRVAVSSGRKDVAKLLLANKADANARNYKGTTPLHVAAEDKQAAIEALKELLP